jgi:NTP pyrophosphatase (non-canonical NTP hydrolase)
MLKIENRATVNAACQYLSMRAGRANIDKGARGARDIALGVNSGELIRHFDCLSHLAHGLADSSGWWIDTETGEDVRTWPAKFLKLWVSAKLLLVVCEVAEGYEAYRKGDKNDDHLPHLNGLTVEIADAIIRLMDLSVGMRLDVAGAIAEKLTYNQQRADHKLENRTKDGGKSI